MDNIPIYCVYLNTEDFHRNRIIYFLVIMSIEENNHWKPFVFYLLIKFVIPMIAIDRSIDDFVRFSCRSNIRKISFSYVEIMNVLQSIESMDFMTNVNVDIISNSGKHLPIVLIVYQ